MSDASALQPAILHPTAPLARIQLLDLEHADVDPRDGLLAACARLDVGATVLGLGLPLCARLGGDVPGLRAFPALAGPAVAVPSTQAALYCAHLGSDRGELLHRSRALLAQLGPGFRVSEVIDAFTYAEGRDLTGYIDGTENPTGLAAATAAAIHGHGPGLDGGSFAAVQRWVHDLDAFGRKTQAERDATIGRSHATNEELASAPSSAHVKRAAQESFEPPAFMLRRSMPFVSGAEAGLAFIAYGESLDRFERVLRRMAGLDDGVVDALFRFSRPVSGGYYFCPPVRGERLDLRALAR